MNKSALEKILEQYKKNQIEKSTVIEKLNALNPSDTWRRVTRKRNNKKIKKVHNY